MRIGVLGGSFDPVHFGHLWIAEHAIEVLQLDHVRWIPAAQSPLKPVGPVAADEDRLAMLRLAVNGLDRHVVDDREIQRGGISYTVDTLEDLSRELPDAQLRVIMGSDSLASLRKWHRPERLLEIAILAVVQRGGDETIDFSVLEGLTEPSRIEEIRSNVIPMPLIEVSSSNLRGRVESGRSIRFRTPRAVEAMIDANGLYRS